MGSYGNLTHLARGRGRNRDGAKFAKDNAKKGVEAQCTWQMRFPSGAMAVCTTGWNSATVNRYRAICDDVAAKGYEGFVMGRAERNATVNDFSAGATIASPGV